MSAIQCLHCGAETSNGLALCETCRAKASVVLEFLPVYFRNLARWRPGRAGSRPVPASREPQGVGVASDGRIVRALDDAGTVLDSWADCLKDDRGIDPNAEGDETEIVATLCRWFNEHMTTIGTLEWAGEFLREISEYENRLRRLTETYVPGWYAGACRHCTLPTYVVPGLTWVKCDGCGATTYARDHLEIILKEARDWVARPRDIAGAIVAMVDSEISVEKLYTRMRKWDQMTWLTGARRLDSDGDPVGPKRYRLGDVLDLALGEADAPTRPMRARTA